MFTRIFAVVVLATLSSPAFAGDKWWQHEARHFARGYVHDTMYLGYQHQQIQLQGYQAAMNLQIQGVQQAQSNLYEDERARMQEQRRRDKEVWDNQQKCALSYKEDIVNGVAVGTKQGRDCSGTVYGQWATGTTSIPYQPGPVTVGKPVSVASASTLTPEVKARLAENEIVRLEVELARARAKAAGN